MSEYVTWLDLKEMLDEYKRIEELLRKEASVETVEASDGSCAMRWNGRSFSFELKDEFDTWRFLEDCSPKQIIVAAQIILPKLVDATRAARAKKIHARLALDALRKIQSSAE